MQPQSEAAAVAGSAKGTTLGLALGGIALAIAVAALVVGFVVPGPAGAAGSTGAKGSQGPQGVNATDLTAFVGSGGNLLWGHGVASTGWQTTGLYWVNFTVRVDDCVPEVTLQNSPDIGSAYLPGSAYPNSVQVLVFETTAAPTDAPFFLAVFC